ncbi:hypothetical protein ASD19_00710 [Microbacterium sp. Root53]|nr:hypothetical protein ASD19_00710 [Microbacterium sp. Root53]
MPVASSASDTAVRSSAVHAVNIPRCGNRPRSTRSRTVSCSGTALLWGSRPSRRATRRVDIRCTDSPSSSTRPASGESTRAMVLSSVDLPHPLGPTIALTTPVGTARSMPSTIGAAPYPTRSDSTRTSAGGAGRRVGVS